MMYRGRGDDDMASKRKYEVQGTKGDETVTIACDDRRTAEDAAEGFKRDGYENVRIVENF